MWTPEIIRARFVEAAHTEQFLPAAMSPRSRGYWPEFFHDDVDKAGWDDAARLDNAEKSKGRASTGAISRHQETMVWTSEIIKQQDSRQIVWAWAFCRANDWDFGSRCVKRGWARPTAYRRLTAAVSTISVYLNNERMLLRLPDEKWVRHETPANVQICSTLENHVSAAGHPFRPSVIYEKSKDMLTTPEAMAAFVDHVENVNAARRKARIRRMSRQEAQAQADA